MLYQICYFTVSDDEKANGPYYEYKEAISADRINRWADAHFPIVEFIRECNSDGVPYGEDVRPLANEELYNKLRVRCLTLATLSPHHSRSRLKSRLHLF